MRLARLLFAGGARGISHILKNQGNVKAQTQHVKEENNTKFSFVFSSIFFIGLLI